MRPDLTDACRNLLARSLWILTLDEFLQGESPTLVFLDEAPLQFAHKPEGLAVLSDREVFLVYDDDRVLSVMESGAAAIRTPNQAPYTILEIDL